MTRCIKHTALKGNRIKSSFVKGLILLCLAGLFLQMENISAQVITNSGAVITVTSGAGVDSKDLYNLSDSIENEGSINLSGDFYNAPAATTFGNGFYNLKGDWTNDGIFTPDTSTVTFNGTANQAINHVSVGETFYRLTVNNPGNIVTQIANAGNSLTVQNHLNIAAGTLGLGSTTANLFVGGKATILGTLLYNSSTLQTAIISGNLDGSGTINMSGGNLPHLLNLTGATNSLGTLATSPAGISTVDYKGTNQTVFPSNNYRNLIISNSGIKILQGNSIVGNNLSITAGTFDLGTIATNLNVLNTTDVIGKLSFNGIIPKTVSLGGNLSGTGEIDMSGSGLAHLLNLYGINNSIATFTSGTGSTVDYVRNGDQNIFTSNNYRNLRINGSGNKILNADIEALGILTLRSGNINTNSNTLKLLNSDIGAIIRTAGTVIGKLQRAIAHTDDDYFYPIGSAASYNPLNIKFRNLSIGPLTARFVADSIGNVGLPLDDDGNEVWKTFPEGYWSLTAVPPMASNNYNIKLDYSNGFTGIDSSSRIVMRIDGDSLRLDGKNGLFRTNELERDSLTAGISTNANDYAISRGRPKIKEQPKDLDVCEGSAAFFDVQAKGHSKHLTYQWQVDEQTGSGYVNLSDGGIYSGTTSKRLDISPTNYGMNGFRYRVIVYDKAFNFNISYGALLTVNKIPIAVASPNSQIVCNNEIITPVVLSTSNNVDFTTFSWVRNNPAGIVSSIDMQGDSMDIGDMINGSFENITLNTITVVFTVIPTGPLTTFCEGNAITFTVTVNPTPRILVNIPLADTAICNGVTTGINIESPHTFLRGTWDYNLTVTPDPSVSGAFGSALDVTTASYTNTLTNSDTVIRKVLYHFKPNLYNDDGTPLSSCASIDTTVIVKVAPTLLSTASPFVYIGGRNIRCFNEENGSIDISPKGGYHPSTGGINPSLYTFKWTKGASDVSAIEDPSGFSVGTYKYAITDKIGCYFEDFVVLTQPDTLLAVATRIDSVSCTGAFNGAVFIDVSGGSKNPDYIFKWTSPTGITTNEDLINAAFGFHNLLIRDANNCSFASSYKVVYADPMTVTESIPKFGDYEISCYGDSTGTISLDAQGNGDKAAYRYYWNNIDDVSGNPQVFPDTADQLTNLPAGTYSVQVVDEWGCEGYGVYPLIAPKPIRVRRTNPLYPGDFDISCPNLSDGVITDTITGGHTASPLDFKWTMTEDPLFIADTKDITNLRAGNYNFSITDLDFGCLGDTIFLLREPDKMERDSYSISDNNGFGVSCKSSDDGFIEPVIIGGFGAKEYSWFRNTDTVSFSNNLNQAGLTVGQYYLYARDLITDCPAKWDFEITEPDTISLDINPKIYNGFEISCFEGDTGSIDLIVSGGVSPYTYNWSSENNPEFSAQTQNVSNLTAGIYITEVRDLNNCIVSHSDTLYQPEKLVTGIVPASVSCFSTNNGAADLSVTGGIENTYVYTWSNGSDTQDIDSLFIGKYFVDIRDANNCFISDTTIITEPPEILIDMMVRRPYNGNRMISCFGESDGIIKSFVSGGVGLNREDGNYVYNWKHRESTWSFNGINEDSISNIPAGEYILTITDGNLCSVSDSILVEQPFKLNTEVYETDPTCAGKSDGQITLIVQGGTPEYLIDWYTIGKLGQTADSLVAGRYDVMITDLNNCQESTYGILRPMSPISFEKDTLNPKCPDTPNGELHYFNIQGGTEPYDLMLFNLDRGDSIMLGEGSDKKVSDLFEGRYRITITDNNQCVLNDTSALEGRTPICIEAPNAFSPNGDGINDTWKIKDIDLYPEVKIEIYNRWGEMVFYAPKGYTKPWDGTYKGRELPIDSYYYVFDLNPTGDKKYRGKTEITGDITIIR